jgi:hypothetical protein
MSEPFQALGRSGQVLEERVFSENLADAAEGRIKSESLNLPLCTVANRCEEVCGI